MLAILGPPACCVADGADQPLGVAVIQAGDSVAEINRDAVGEARGQQEDTPLPAEQGRPPLARAVTAASQSIAAIAVPLLVPWPMNRLVKSPRFRNVPFDEQGDASFERVEPGGAGPQARTAAVRSSAVMAASGSGYGRGGDVAGRRGCRD